MQKPSERIKEIIKYFQFKKLAESNDTYFMYKLEAIIQFLDEQAEQHAKKSAECEHEYRANKEGHPHCTKCGKYAYNDNLEDYEKPSSSSEPSEDMSKVPLKRKYDKFEKPLVYKRKSEPVKECEHEWGIKSARYSQKSSDCFVEYVCFKCQETTTRR